MIELLKSKIHRASVSKSDINYEGSITIYKELMDKAHIYEYEKVVVVDINNGKRFETYVIEGNDPLNAICVNGAAARLVHIGDKVIIMSYRFVDEKERIQKFGINYKPIVVCVDDNNRIK